MRNKLIYSAIFTLFIGVSAQAQEVVSSENNVIQITAKVENNFCDIQTPKEIEIKKIENNRFYAREKIEINNFPCGNKSFNFSVIQADGVILYNNNEKKTTLFSSLQIEVERSSNIISSTTKPNMSITSSVLFSSTAPHLLPVKNIIIDKSENSNFYLTIIGRLKDTNQIDLDTLNNGKRHTGNFTLKIEPVF